MKKIISMIFAVAIVLPIAAQKEKPDTLLNAMEVGKLVIIDGADGLTVKTMNGNDSAASFNYHQSYGDNVRVTSKKTEYRAWGNPKCSLTKDSTDRKWDYFFISGSLNLGFVAGLSTPAGMSIDPWQSAEVSWLQALSLEAVQKNGKNTFVTGLGFTWRNYRMTDGNRFCQNGGVTTIAPYPAGIERDHSRLKVFSLSVPMLWMYRFSKHHYLRLGPILNFNTYSSIKTEYNDGGRIVEELQKGQRRVPVTVDLYGSISIWNSIGLYLRYSPCNVLKTATGPKIIPLSFGLSIGI